MLDVHILLSHDTRPDWQRQCISSVVQAARRAGYPVAVHKVSGVPGHLGHARAGGYAMGSQPYVTSVDDDDYVTPDAFAALADALRSGVEAVTTGETHLYESGAREDCPDTRHHLAVFRRDALTRGYDDYRYYPDQYLLSRVQAVHIPRCVYVHRIYMSSGSRQQRRGNPAAADAELQAIRRPDLFVAEAMTPAQIAAEYDAMLGADA